MQNVFRNSNFMLISLHKDEDVSKNIRKNDLDASKRRMIFLVKMLPHKAFDINNNLKKHRNARCKKYVTVKNNIPTISPKTTGL